MLHEKLEDLENNTERSAQMRQSTSTQLLMWPQFCDIIERNIQSFTPGERSVRNNQSTRVLVNRYSRASNQTRQRKLATEQQKLPPGYKN